MCFVNLQIQLRKNLLRTMLKLSWQILITNKWWVTKNGIEMYFFVFQSFNCPTKKIDVLYASVTES